ncbi:alpha/beta hydrolase [Streptomyces sp. RLB3-17]|nr:alpha/beta hydrolase [Streptomyces sp. S1A1-7]QDN93050.1 alpha/beta hydrolase [Streptomyces sp. RLB3-6]QDO03538.1 alpha/beta hydrolase [Streptomyces sp. RLB1-9]QDO13871.1 alpha/beta hydrolase [Streptomyces sp. S1D4-23]QDO25269.1 alpha/beta hydrolase [Streptomyces sp. S1A1-8]QDO35390.1 alpha/beta hydrolase [Streptomyces sp. S1A1-3]QDO45406.1 alpha/beta hydrolase [Streptomyces sp. RLB3-17]
MPSRGARTLSTINTGLPEGCEERFVALEHHYDDIEQIRMHWVTAGAGDPVVLLHGWPQTWYEWRHLIPVLAERHLVIAPDLRGWGETERPADGYDVATAAADVRHLLDHLGIASAHVIGHDWGTPIGYYLAATARDRVVSFTALEASIPGAGGEDLLNFSRAWNPLWFFPFLATPELPQQLIGGGGQETFFTWMLTQMCRATPGSLTDEDIAVYVKAYSDDDAVRSSCAYYVNTWASADQVRDAAQVPLNVPVLAIAGERSLGQNMIDFVRRLAPDAEGVILPGCGHLVPEERPAELAQLVTDFLAGIDSHG